MPAPRRSQVASRQIPLLREGCYPGAESLVAVHDATFLLGPAFCAAIGNGLILGYLMLRSGLVPRRFAQFGMERHAGVNGPLIPVLAAPELVPAP